MRAIVESPFKTGQIRLADGNVVTVKEEDNLEYARACCRWCVDRGMAPFASHLMYPQFMDDGIHYERHRGIMMGFKWGKVAGQRFFFVDRGFSDGMIQGLEEADRIQQSTKIIKIGGDWDLGWVHGEPTWADVNERIQNPSPR